MINKNVTIEDVRKSKPEIIYYGARTCWWTHNGEHLGKNKSGLPCDPRGGVLFQTSDVEGFLKAAEENKDHYGKHGLDAFMAAHHSNCSLATGKPWCYPTWDDYNRDIDSQCVKKLRS
jgi:hypothetical protein